MYNPTILEHLENPRNGGAMPDATTCGTATNPVCGDSLHLYLKVEDRHVVAASFQAQACPPCLAAASVLTEMLTGHTLAEAWQLKTRDVNAALGGLPRNKEHCATLALDALRAALAEIG